MMERTLSSRINVGSTAHVLHTQPLMMRHITIDEPTIILVRHGRKIIRWAQEEITLEAGDAVVIGEGHSFDIINTPSPLTGTYEASWLSFCADFVQNYCFMHAPRMSMNEANKMAEPGNSFRQAFYHTAEAITDTENIPESIVARRMEEMLSWLDEYRIFFALKQHTGLAIKIRKLVAADISQDWNTAQVAAAFGMSATTLRRHLHAENTSFTHLVTDIRMCRALTLLQVTDLSVTRISLEVGYENPSKFAARFRTRFGFSPSLVRVSGQAIGNLAAVSGPA